MIQVVGGKKFERDVATKTVVWSIKRLSLSRIKGIDIFIKIKSLNNCAGYCEELNDDDRSFIIAVDNNQSLRDFVITVIHEMVHVRQYVRNKWEGDGETEAWSLQYSLADELWKDNIL
jgi:hypothetical protein